MVNTDKSQPDNNKEIKLRIEATIGKIIIGIINIKKVQKFATNFL
jgi:hypothetical protein